MSFNQSEKEFQHDQFIIVLHKEHTGLFLNELKLDRLTLKHLMLNYLHIKSVFVISTAL